MVMVRRRRYLRDFAGVSDNARMWIGMTTVRRVRISPPKDSNRIIDDDERSGYSSYDDEDDDDDAVVVVPCR